jgi:hypothetical protein
MSYTKKAAAFGKLVGICAGYEGKYNPARQNLTLNAIRNLEAQAVAANAGVALAQQNWIKAVINRQMTFQELRDISSRLGREIFFSETDAATKKLVLSAVNKVTAYNKAGNADPPADSGETAPATRRASGKDYASRLAAFEELVQIMAANPDYRPSTPALSVDALQAKRTEVKGLMDRVNETFAAMQTARGNRRELFGKRYTGVMATALSVKFAIRSIFGSKSDELAAVKAIRFNN